MHGTSILLSAPTEAEVLDFGPDLAGVSALVRTFEPTGHAYFALGSPADPTERELRWRRLAEQLRSRGAGQQLITRFTDAVAATAPAPDTLALFADAGGRLVELYRLAGSTLTDQCGFGTPPTVLPLLDWRQSRPPFLAIAIDRYGADLCYSSGGDAPLERTTVVGSFDADERNTTGYWSERRYQQRALDSWRHTAAEVAEAAQQLSSKVGAQVLLLTGDIRAIQLLRQRLPHRPDLLIEQFAGGRSTDSSPAHRAEQFAEALRTAASLQNALILQRLHTQLGSAGLAVQGMRDTVAALAEGRVALLVVNDDVAPQLTAWFGPEATQIYPNEPVAKLAGCVGAVEAPLADVAVRAALLTGARVRVLPAGITGLPVGGIGALCRFRR